MSNVTVQRLGDEAQKDNDPHRLDYIRHDQKTPIYRNRTTGNDIHSYGVVGLMFFGLVALVLWLLKAATCWGVSPYDVPVECTVLSVSAVGWTAGVPLLVVASWVVLLYGKTQKDRSEAMANRIVRDRYSNPVDALAVLQDTPDMRLGYFLQAQAAEVAVAPHKALPAGLDSLSISQGTGKGAAALMSEEDAKPLIEAVAVDTWLKWLNETPHLLLAAQTGGGKTTTTKAILAERIAAHSKLLVIDPHSSEWLGLPVIGGGEDWTEVKAALRVVEQEYRDRLLTRDAYMDETGEELPVSHFERLTVLLDEANITQANLDDGPRGKPTVWKQFIKVLGSGARKVNISIIMLCQSANVEDLGISGGYRQNFTRIALDDRTIRHMVSEEPNSERRKALMDAVAGRDYPATLSRKGEVFLLDRTGLDRYPLPSPDVAREHLWGGWDFDSVRSVRSSDEALKRDETAVSARTNERTDAERFALAMQDRGAKLRMLKQMRDGGKTRDQARDIFKRAGAGFTDTDWTEAGK
jgi:hypothetical protein